MFSFLLEASRPSCVITQTADGLPVSVLAERRPESITIPACINSERRARSVVRQ